jgi:hypothetical protein
MRAWLLCTRLRQLLVAVGRRGPRRRAERQPRDRRRVGGAAALRCSRRRHSSRDRHGDRRAIRRLPAAWPGGVAARVGRGGRGRLDGARRRRRLGGGVRAARRRRGGGQRRGRPRGQAGGGGPHVGRVVCGLRGGRRRRRRIRGRAGGSEGGRRHGADPGGRRRPGADAACAGRHASGSRRPCCGGGLRPARDQLAGHRRSLGARGYLSVYLYPGTMARSLCALRLCLSASTARWLLSAQHFHEHHRCMQGPQVATLCCPQGCASGSIWVFPLATYSRVLSLLDSPCEGHWLRLGGHGGAVTCLLEHRWLLAGRRPAARPMGYTWSYLACRIGRSFPVWRACTRVALQLSRRRCNSPSESLAWTSWTIGLLSPENPWMGQDRITTRQRVWAGLLGRVAVQTRRSQCTAGIAWHQGRARSVTRGLLLGAAGWEPQSALVSGGADGCVMAWDLRPRYAGTPIFALSVHTAPVRSAAQRSMALVSLANDDLSLNHQP